eukprot:NODE_47_length_27404_cov_0.284270.p6 type:complete len:475 gc:universal NODE_47_length_27404_cov_0.284270:16804-18228(+)
MLIIPSLVWSVTPIADCSLLQSIAISLNMDKTNSEIMKQILSDCCATSGITCNNGRVNTINWASLRLNGTINSTQLLPSALTSLKLDNNILSGNITNLELPSTMIVFSAVSNRLVGSVPKLPYSLQYLQLDNNILTGLFPILNSKLTYCSLSNNQISGSLPSFLPAAMMYFKVQANALTGPFSLGTYPNSLKYVYIQKNLLQGTVTDMGNSSIIEFTAHANLLSGKVPSFPVTLKQLILGYEGFPGNQFTGAVELYQPKVLRLNNNLISSVIIYNTSLLTTCDLSYNPFLNILNVIDLNCLKNGLYVPNQQAPREDSLSTSAFMQSSPTVVITYSIPQDSKIQDSKTEETESNPVTALENFTEKFYGTISSIQKLKSRSSKMYSSPTDKTDLKSFTSLGTANFYNTKEVLVQGPSTGENNGSLVYWLFGGFALACALLFLAAAVFKSPKIYSKFGRKNSFATLNTFGNKTVSNI